EPDLLGRAAASAAVLDSATIAQHALAAFDYRPLAGPDTSCPAGSGWPGPVAAGCPAADTSAQYGHHSHGVQPGTNLSTARWKLEKPGPCPGFFSLRIQEQESGCLVPAPTLYWPHHPSAGHCHDSSSIKTGPRQPLPRGRTVSGRAGPGLASIGRPRGSLHPSATPRTRPVRSPDPLGG